MPQKSPRSGEAEKRIVCPQKDSFVDSIDQEPIGSESLKHQAFPESSTIKRNDALFNAMCDLSITSSEGQS